MRMQEDAPEKQKSTGFNTKAAFEEFCKVFVDDRVAQYWKQIYRQYPANFIQANRVSIDDKLVDRAKQLLAQYLADKQVNIEASNNAKSLVFVFKPQQNVKHDDRPRIYAETYDSPMVN